MSTARNVTFSAYVLWPGPVERALEDAARRGAHVKVRLNGYFDRHTGTPEMLSCNKEAIRMLAALGCDARLAHRSRNDGPCLHLKAAVCDDVAFLDDRNWAGSSNTVIRDDTPADVRAIRTRASLGTAHCRGVQLNKADALKTESALLARSRGDRVDVAVESIGPSHVYSALMRLAQSGAKPRLLISRPMLSSNRRWAERLAQVGVRVRVAPGSEKFAVTAHREAWIGSANATSTFYDADQIDWGTRTGDSRIVRALEAHFDAQWRMAAPLTNNPS